MAKITQSQMAKMFQRFATSYHAGLDILSILNRESNSGSPLHRTKASRLAQQVGKGKTLAEAMQSTNGYFPELAISVVHAGERGGRLEESFGRLADHYRSLVDFRNKFLAALAWPLFELVFAILIVGGLMALCDWIFSIMEIEKFNWLLMGSTAGNVAAYFVLVFLLMTGFVVLGLGNSPWLVWNIAHENRAPNSVDRKHDRMHGHVAFFLDDVGGRKRWNESN